MPTKKTNQAAKRPVKAAPKKTAHKVAAPKKKQAKAPAKPTPIATTKVPVKQPKSPKAAAPKPAAAKPSRPKVAPPEAVAEESVASVAAEKSAPIKFDPRPLVMPRASAAANSDEDGEEGSSALSLLAGPRNVKPYIARRGEQYMNKEQLEHFARILQTWKRDLMVEVDRTVLHMKDEAANFPDPNDRATQEEEFSLELRTRDRERKLIRKIDEALKRIEDGSYGYCLETGEEIGIKRLEARPVATLSVEAQERRERREKQYGDRDDRYR
jgi:DnaK suppressor protein